MRESERGERQRREGVRERDRESFNRTLSTSSGYLLVV